MKRREAIRRSLTGIGGIVAISSLDMLVACSENTQVDHFLTTKENELVVDLVDLIIPRTDTASASEAGVVEFLDIAMAECFRAEDQNLFRNGMMGLAEMDFLELSSQKQVDHLNAMEKEGDSFFGLLKELTLIGYFTSEIGIKQNFEYQPVPGLYKGCVAFQPSDKAWRGNSL